MANPQNLNQFSRENQPANRGRKPGTPTIQTKIKVGLALFLRTGEINEHAVSVILAISSIVGECFRDKGVEITDVELQHLTKKAFFRFALDDIGPEVKRRNLIECKKMYKQLKRGLRKKDYKVLEQLRKELEQAKTLQI